MATKKKRAKPGKPPPHPGQPTKYNERMASRILALAEAGNSYEEIASKVGIAPRTLLNWLGKYPDFRAALKDSRNMAIDLVEGALFQNAMGHSHPAVKHFYDSKTGKIISQPYIERHKPDTTAQIFFLKNRAPDRWRDVHKLEHGGAGGGPIQHVVEERRRLFVEVVAEPATAELAEQLAMQMAQRRLEQLREAETRRLPAANGENQEDQA